MNITARVRKYSHRKIQRKTVQPQSPKIGSLVQFDANGTPVQGRVIKSPVKVGTKIRQEKKYGIVRGEQAKPKTFKDKRTKMKDVAGALISPTWFTPQPNDPHTYMVKLTTGPMRGKYTTVNALHSRKFKILDQGDEGQ